MENYFRAVEKIAITRCQEARTRRYFHQMSDLEISKIEAYEKGKVTNPMVLIQTGDTKNGWMRFPVATLDKTKDDYFLFVNYII